MRTRCRPALLAAAFVVLLAACSDDSSGGTEGTDGTTSASGSALTTDGADTSSPDDSNAGTTTAGATTTSVAAGGSSTTVAGGVSTTLAPAPPESDPFATAPEPDPTEPDDMPGPPADDCVDAVAGPLTVEIAFDDDRIIYAGATAPSCVRVHAGQQLVLRSTSGAASTVLVGPDTYDIAAGATATTPALGTLYGVGEVFDVYVEHLDTTVVVQVLP